MVDTENLIIDRITDTERVRVYEFNKMLLEQQKKKPSLKTRLLAFIRKVILWKN